MTLKLKNEIKYTQPGSYHLRVLGSIPTQLWDYYEGKTDQVIVDKNKNVITTIKMHVRDQAELSGLINMLYNFRLVILSVKLDGIDEDKEINQHNK